MQQLIGQTIDRYQVDRLLGEGRVGDVYYAQDVNLARAVALKVIKPELLITPDFATRFVPAARALGRLEHPGLVRVFDFGQTEKIAYLVMDYLEGPPLADLLFAMRASQRWIALTEALRLVQQLAQVVDYLQRQGAPRRRLFPAKIKVRARVDGLAHGESAVQPVMIDLGLHGSLLPTSGLPSAVTPALLAYLPPEEIFGEATDGRSDVYALGVLAYELTTGQLPLVARTLGEAVDIHLNQKVLAVRAALPMLPDPVAAIIEKALAPTLAERYANAGALLNALAALPFDRLPEQFPPAASAGITTLLAQLTQPNNALEVPTARLPQAEEAGIAKTLAYNAALPVRAVPGAQATDQLQILGPKEKTQTIALAKPSITIGRTPDNDVVLDDPRVSRKHARLEMTGSGWQIVDLNSANGIYVVKTRLAPGGTSKIEYDTPVRVGDHSLRVLQGEVTKGVGANSPQVAPTNRIFIKSIDAEIERTQILSSSDAQSVGLFLPGTQYGVEPGKSMTIPLILLNQKSISDAFLIAVGGAPPAWLHLASTRIELASGEQRQILLEIKPARSPQTQAKTYSIRINVASQNVPGQIVLAEIKIMVRRYVQFQVNLQPSSVQTGEPIQVSIANQGNARQAFTLAWWDEQHELIFEPATDTMEISPGEVGATRFIAFARKPRWFGAAHLHPITVQISPLYAGVQLYQAQIISRGRIPIG